MGRKPRHTRHLFRSIAMTLTYSQAKNVFLSLLLGACFALLPQVGAAQTAADSLTILQKTWTETEVKPGLIWKKAHFEDLFDSRQSVNFIEIDLNHPDRRIAYTGVSTGFKRTSEFVREAGAAAGINATFFNTSTGESVTLLKIGGTIINETTLLLANGQRNERASGAVLIHATPNGKQQVQVIAGDNTQGDWDQHVEADHVLVSGPVMLLDGSYADIQQNAFNNNRHPRSAVAVLPGNKVILLTVDGRNAQAQGMSIHELAFLLKVLGAEQALNLDGGGSTALYIEGATDNGIVNYPSDNQQFDHQGERRVANAIIVY